MSTFPFRSFLMALGGVAIACSISGCAARGLAPRDVAHALKAATASKRTARTFYDSLPVGEFRGEATITWVSPNRFRFDNGVLDAFAFIPHGGRSIVPGSMETDGGSIPRPLWSVNGLAPWDFGPAYIIHDWLFERHHAGDPAYADMSLEEAGLIMASGIKTLMEAPPPPGATRDLIPANPDVLYRIYHAVVSKWADGLWRRYPVPGLPRS